MNEIDRKLYSTAESQREQYRQLVREWAGTKKGGDPELLMQKLEAAGFRLCWSRPK